MKKLLTSILLLFFLFGCESLSNTKVEQEVRNDDSRVICPSGNCFCTYIWWDGEIVWDRVDDMNSLSDSLVLCRKIQANNVLKSLKNKP